MRCLSVTAVLCQLTWLAVGPALAESVPCPDLSNIVQVGTCPSEEELRYTYKGYCSDNARMYDKATDVCEDYGRYRTFKNTGLWETRDGRFSGYLSCDREGDLSRVKPKRITVSKQGSVTRVACVYEEGITLTYRTKAQCTVPANGCASPSVACAAECE